MEHNFNPIKLIGEVMALAYLINSNTEYCTFIDYSGHVDKLEISVRKSKDDTKTKLYNSEFYVDGRHGIHDPEQELINLKKALEGFIYPNITHESQQESTRP